MSKRAVAFFSGGKDSVMAIIKARKLNISIDYLLFNTLDFPRQNPHQLNQKVVETIAELMGIPLITKHLEKGLEAPMLRETLLRLGANMVVSGNINVDDQIQWYKDICEPINIEVITPLYIGSKRNSLNILLEELEAGIKPVIVHVDGKYLPKQMVGEVIDEELATELTARCDPCGENGEFHTLVLEAPIMSKGSVTIEHYDVLTVNGHHLMAVKDYSVRRG